MAKILGFDCSSTTVGWGLIEYDDQFNILDVKCDHFKPTKDGSIFERLEFVRTEVNKIISLHQPDNIVIEDIVKFMARASSAQTIITLAVFNRTIGMTCYDALKKDPELMSVMTIRHKIKEDKIIPKKEEIPERLEKILGINFPYLINSKNLKVKEESYDRADGLAVATAWFLIKKTPAKVKKAKKK